MTNEEAIKVLNDPTFMGYLWRVEQEEAIDVATKALEQQDEVYYRKLCIEMELKLASQAQQIFVLREKLKKETKLKEKYYKEVKDIKERGEDD